MTDVARSVPVLWVAEDLPPAYRALFEEISDHLPGSLWLTPEEAGRIGRQPAGLIHAIGRPALIRSRRLARRQGSPLVYECEPLSGSDGPGEKLARYCCRPDIVIGRDPACDATGAGDVTRDGLAQVALPPVVVPPEACASPDDTAGLHVGIVIDGLGRHERRLLGRALSWIPRDRGFVCLLFGSARNCRRMARLLRWQFAGGDSPVHLVERDRLQVEDWLRCAISVHTLQSTGSAQMLAEAMAAGNAVIVHDTGSPSGISDGDDGLLIQPFNPFDLCRSLQYLQAQPGLLRMIADTARARALSRYGTRRAATLLIELYDHVAIDRGRNRGQRRATCQDERRIAGPGTSKRYRDAGRQESSDVPGRLALSRVRHSDPPICGRSRP